MKVGLVGVSGSGKSTLFRALARLQGPGSNRAATLQVPDERLLKLSELVDAKKTTPAEVLLHDLPALSIRGSQEAESVAAARGVDLIAHVVGAYVDPGNSKGIAAKEIRAFEEEIILLDQGLIESRIERISHMIRVGRKEEAPELDLLQRCKQVLEEGRSLREEVLSPAEEKRLRGFQLLTMKPRFVILNIAESDLSAGFPGLDAIRSQEAAAGAEVTAVCAQLERELAELPPEELQSFLSEMGIGEPGREKLIRAVYAQVGLLTFFTAGRPEARAWTVRRGTPAVEAAGEIHSDMERGFIRAEVIRYDDFVTSGSYAAARSKGLVRLEGREYPIEDGDVLLIRFSA